MHSSLAAAARRFKAGTACVRLILFFLLLTLLLAPTLRVSANESKPALMLAKVYHPGLDLRDYWVSEKYDGMRGYWDGKQLLTRGGEPVFAPTWFTAGWLEVPMDGELWAGRGQFQQTVATVRKKRQTTTLGAAFASWCLTCQPMAERSLNASRHSMPTSRK
jgi:hypothetical protein